MQAFIMLCDSAQRDGVSGKMHMLGGDWSVVGPDLPSMAVAVFLRIPWSEVDHERPFVLRLLDEGGKPVLAEQDGEDESIPIQFVGDLKLEGAVTLPVDHPGRQVDIHTSFAVNVLLPSSTLEPGSYRWSLEVAAEEAASVAFVLRPRDQTQGVLAGLQA